MSRDRKVYLISSFLIQSVRKAASRIAQRDNRKDRTAIERQTSEHFLRRMR